MIFITSPGNIVQTHLGYITLSHYHRYHTLSGRQGFIIKTDRSKHLFLINIRILSYHIWTARIMTIMTIIGYPAQNHNILIKLILHLSFKSDMSGVWLVCQYYTTTAHMETIGRNIPAQILLSASSQWLHSDHHSISWHISQLQSNYSNIDRSWDWERLKGKKLFTNQAKCIAEGNMRIICWGAGHISIMVFEECQILCQVLKLLFTTSFSSQECGLKDIDSGWNMIRGLGSYLHLKEGCYLISCKHCLYHVPARMEKDLMMMKLTVDNHWKLLPIYSKCLGGY